MPTAPTPAAPIKSCSLGGPALGMAMSAAIRIDRPTIADVSLAGYLYYPAEEFGFDIGKDHAAIGAWRERVKALPGWAHPYDLMPGHPIPA